MATSVGLEPVAKLVDWRAGTRLYVPEKLDHKHNMVQRIGMLGARWLLEHDRKERIDVPKCDAFHTKLRNYEIRMRYKGGEPVSRLALDYGLVERSIYFILKPHRATRNET